MCFQSSQRWQGPGRGSWPHFQPKGWKLVSPMAKESPMCLGCIQQRHRSRSETKNLAYVHYVYLKPHWSLQKRHKFEALTFSVAHDFSCEFQYRTHHMNVPCFIMSYLVWLHAFPAAFAVQASFDHWLFRHVAHLEPTRPARAKI